jgi:hypothetical protein
MGLAVTFEGEPLDRRPTGIGEPKQLRDLVEGLPRSVIPGLTQQAVLPPLSRMK